MKEHSEIQAHKNGQFWQCVIQDLYLISLIPKSVFLFLLQIDSNRHLEWLKTIQKAHGSVEVSSLAQAEAINSGGVFSCGYVWKIQDDIVLVRSTFLLALVTWLILSKKLIRNVSFLSITPPLISK